MNADDRLLEMIDRFGPEIHIAGIVECRAALRLVEAGKVRIVRGSINGGDFGGSGVITRKDN